MMLSINDFIFVSQFGDKNKIVVGKLPSLMTAYPTIKPCVTTFKELDKKSKTWILLTALLNNALVKLPANRFKQGSK